MIWVVVKRSGDDSSLTAFRILSSNNGPTVERGVALSRYTIAQGCHRLRRHAIKPIDGDCFFSPFLQKYPAWNRPILCFTCVATRKYAAP